MSATESAQLDNASAARRLFYGPSGLRAGWRLLIFFVIVFALFQSGTLIVRRNIHGLDKDILFIVRKALYFLSFLLASWIMGKIEGKTIADYGLPWRRMFRSQFCQGALIGFASITALVALLRLVGVYHFGSIALRGAEIWKWAGIYTLVFIFVGLTEEFSSRGYALFTLSTGIGFWPAAILSAAYFGYCHLGNSGENWVGAFNAGAFGLLCCLLLRRTGNLWMSIGFHATWDWGETFFYGVADSGWTAPGHLLNSSSSGSAWLSGGSVGPEGSWVATLLLVVLWLIFSAWLRQANYPEPTAMPDPPRSR